MSLSLSLSLCPLLSTVPGTDGYSPSVDDGNEMTLLMHKDFAQEVAPNKDGTLPNRERETRIQCSNASCSR